jgi:hypothetical protein
VTEVVVRTPAGMVAMTMTACSTGRHGSM